MAGDTSRSDAFKSTEEKAQTTVPSTMPKQIQDAIDSAGKRIEDTEDQEQIAAWKKTTWEWAPNDQQFKNNSKIAAFVDSQIPNKIFVGAAFMSFANASKSFTYHQASFKGGATALLFVALHEFGHVWTAGKGTPGTPERERMANKLAFRWLPRVYRSEVKCIGCIE